MRFADSADDNDKLGGGTEKYKTKIAINSNGSCKWMAPAIFQSTCDINTEFFPFDDQVCHLFIFTYLVIQVLVRTSQSTYLCRFGDQEHSSVYDFAIRDISMANICELSDTE